MPISDEHKHEWIWEHKEELDPMSFGAVIEVADRVCRHCGDLYNTKEGTMSTDDKIIQTAAEVLCAADHEAGGLAEYSDSAVAVVAAVRPLIERKAHRAGYETARQDLISGAFVGGPTYEALRDSASGRKIAAEALREAAKVLGEQGVEPWNRNSVAIQTLNFLADAKEADRKSD